MSGTPGISGRYGPKGEVGDLINLGNPIGKHRINKNRCTGQKIMVY